MIRVLVVEDGHEYIESLQRFMGEGFTLGRAGDGFEAMKCLEDGTWDVILMDMCFDRSSALLGKSPELVRRLGGDEERVRLHLEQHQGTYIVASIREAGHRTPVVFSYDFDAEPRRFSNLRRRYAPLAYLDDMAGPPDFRLLMTRMVNESRSSE